MYQIRWWQQPDLPWLQQAAAAGAWESMSAEERAGVHPATAAHIAEQQLMSVIGSGWGSALVAETAGRPVGFLLMTPGPDASTEETHGLVLSVWVAPEHRRRGIARSLQNTAEQIFAHMGMRKVKVWTGIHNLPALNLAVRNGYVPEGLIGMKSL